MLPPGLRYLTHGVEKMLPPGLRYLTHGVEKMLPPGLRYLTHGVEKMLPPGLQICLRPRVTLTFDLVTPKTVRFMPLPICIKIFSFGFKISRSQIW